MNTHDIHNSLPDERLPVRPHTITCAHVDSILSLLEGGENLDVILARLRAHASNTALRHMSMRNKLVGHHRKDFRAHIRGILASRKK